MKMRRPKKAIVRSQNGEAQDRVDWKRNGWHDAKIEGAGAKCDLRNEQQRAKREESREKSEERREGIEASQDHDGKEKREERREEREERREKREKR